ncbi:MAG: nucleotidyl transferase AbiEii/AbiGii toxin family protein, partial [Calditrichaceae bacterium]
LIYDSPYAARLVFMGGTAIRIIHGSARFSEDLDFDNFGITNEEFTNLIEFVHKTMALEGYIIETRNVFKSAFHSYLGFSDILYKYKISQHKTEKLMIRIDTEPQGITYQPDQTIINKFDIFTRINVVPDDILLAQKIFAILRRKRAMGRDFFDTVYLFNRTKPNFDYLRSCVNIKNMIELKEALLSKCDNLNLKLLSEDIGPFLINQGDKSRVLLFREFIKTLNG